MLRNKFSTFLKTVFSITALVFAASCNDAPTEVGSGFVKDTTLVTQLATSENTALLAQTRVERIGRVRLNDLVKNIGFGNPTILVGAAESGQKAYSFVNPGILADSLADITNDQIVSTTLVLPVAGYAFGDTTAEFSFSVHSLKKLWNYADTLETVFPLSGSTSEYFDENAVVATFKKTINRSSDTAAELSIPKEIIADWFATRDSSKGFALAPNASSRYIQQFRALTSNLTPAMHIRVAYSRNGTPDTLKVPLTYYGSFVQSQGPSRPEEILIQSGTSYRTAFDIDLTFIPQLSSIHSARFVLHLKNEQISSRRRRIVLLERIPNSAGNFIDVLASYGVTSEDNPGRYEFTGLSARVEKWLRGERKGKLYIATENESETADRIVFHGMDADNTLRPRFEVLYSTRPR